MLKEPLRILFNYSAGDDVVFGAIQLNIAISHIEQMNEETTDDLSITALILCHIVAWA